MSEAPLSPIAATQAWLERAVIGLNLCPFAKGVHSKGRIRWVQSPATTPEALRAELVAELQGLAAADEDDIETTLLVHPQVLQDFRAFNDFLALADLTLVELGLEGTLQIASFHPHYRFAGTRASDISNATNRSPYPTLHLLRESSIERAVASTPDAEAIFGRNIETLRSLGHAGWRRLMAGLYRQAE